ncbi:MAG TPA: hypothetical protein VIV57_08290 [Anaeromyxobacter sp.]
MAGDWKYEEFEEAEPYEAEPYEAEPYEAEPYEASDELDEAEYEPEYDGEAAPYFRDHRRPLPQPPLRGVQSVTLTTPRGPATIQLPSKVPTLAELSRVQRELAVTKRRMRRLSADMARSRRASRARARSDDRGARSAVLVLALEEVRKVLSDVGTFSLIRDAVPRVS